jgi:hypothetical protein
MNFFDVMNLAPSQRGDAGDEMVQKILILNAIDYLPPVATFSSRSGTRRTANVRAGMIREDNKEYKNVFITVREMSPLDFSQ